MTTARTSTARSSGRTPKTLSHDQGHRSGVPGGMGRSALSPCRGLGMAPVAEDGPDGSNPCSCTARVISAPAVPIDSTLVDSAMPARDERVGPGGGSP
jgi:hypothetical protein